MRAINLIVVHCAFTRPYQDIGVADIRAWHVNERGWSDIGYHYVIRRNGNLEIGRPEEIPGAHVKGFNQNSLGICLAGGKGEGGQPECNYTIEQYVALERLLVSLKANYPNAEIAGHYEFDSGKECPCFNVREFIKL